MKYVKASTIIVDLIALGIWVYAFATDEFLRNIREYPVDVLVMSAILICIILNLIIAFSFRPARDSWLGLYFKRRRLEEQRRIEALEKGENKTN